MERRFPIDGAIVKRVAAIMAWAVLAVIAFSTLAPIGLRPYLGSLVHVERFGAFALLGFLFALVYPRRIWLVLACVVAAAIGLEALQTLAAGRHARVIDFVVKAAGGAAGVGVAWLVLRNRVALERLVDRIKRNAGSAR